MSIPTISKIFLVTGAAGYIGSHMCHALRKKYPDCFLVTIDNLSTGYAKNLRWDDVHLRWDLRYLNEDHGTQLGQTLGKTIDAVFHFAASSIVSEGEKFPYEYAENNIKSTIDLYRLVLPRAKNFIFSSTAAVYGNQHFINLACQEDSPKQPNSVYGQTKMIAEDYLLGMGKLFPKMKIGILRYFNVAGRNIESGLREEHNPETHLIPCIVHDPKNFTIYGNSTNIRDFVHVEDLVEGHIQTYEYLDQKEHGRIVLNLGSGITLGTTVDQVVIEAKSLGIPLEIKSITDSRPGDVYVSVADISRARRMIGYNPTKSSIKNILLSELNS
jgi:UDP-glucose 4-epimerase